MNSHGLRWLNSNWGPTEDSEEELSLYLRDRAISAGKLVGVTFTPGRSTPRQDMEGQLSLGWLRDAAADASAFAHEHWDPGVAHKIQDAAAAGGRATDKGLTCGDLIPLEGKSVSVQAKTLGCSPRKISYLRAKLAAQAK